MRGRNSLYAALSREDRCMLRDPQFSELCGDIVISNPDDLQRKISNMCNGVTSVLWSL